MYLDSQQKWKEFEVAEHGLHNLLRHLVASMHSTAKAGHCAAVMPLCLFCRRACQLQRQYKGSRQVVRQLMIYMKGVLGLSSPGYTMRRSSSLHLLSGAG
ncbi:hypothetical protein ABBQ32_004693 [Trebouxia sp. C0010 RCD-2024]